MVQPRAVPALGLDSPINADTRPLAVADSPLLKSIDVGDLVSGSDVTYAVPPWAQVDLSVGDRALLAHGVVYGRRTAVIGFDLAGPGVTQAPWFPVFWSNVVRWADPFAPLPDGADLEPGTTGPANPASAGRSSRRNESGRGLKTEFTVPEPAVLEVTVPGVYTVRQFVGEELMAQTSIEFAPGLATRTVRGGACGGAKRHG